jgi:peptidoglycan/LPS O-acetylase OafA/YrhL
MRSTDSPQPRALTRARSRIPALDGIRGVAALAVLFSHLLDVRPELAWTVYEPREQPDSLWGKVLTYTPLHVAWDGTSAVYLFYVLSGFVLAVPMFDASLAAWVRYFPRRLVRIYLPVFVSVGLGLGWMALVPRVSRPGAGYWLNSHPSSVSPGDVLSDLLLFPTPGRINGALWSLKSEVVFSLTLPVYVLALRKCRLRLGLPAVLALIVAGAWTNQPAAMFLPMFAVGVLLARDRDCLTTLGDRLSRRLPRSWGWLFLALALCLSSSYWMAAALPLRGSAGSAALALGRGGQVLGAALLIFLALSWRPAERTLDSRPVQWLGARSFSLYLVQEPIVVSIALLLPRPGDIVGVGAASLLAIWGATQAFYVLVERPSHQLSRRVARGWPFRRPLRRDRQPALPARTGRPS